FLRLGIVLIAILVLEVVGIFVYTRSLGFGTLVPIVEPYLSIAFAIPGVGLLILRVERRQLTLKHFRVQAQAEALKRLGPLFASLRERLDTELAVLGVELRRLDAESAVGKSLPLLDRAMGRIADVSARLGRLEHLPVATDP